MNGSSSSSRSAEVPYVQGLIRAAADDLVSLISYREDAPSVIDSADMELLVICRSLTPDLMGRLRGHRKNFTKTWAELRLFTPGELRASMDVFPVEASEILRAYRVIFGEDVLSGVTVQASHLRHQLEFELRSKKHLLLGHLLEEDESGALVGSVVLAFAGDFLRLGHHYLSLRGKVAIGMDALLSGLSRDPGVSPEVLLTLGRISSGELRPADGEKKSILWAFVEQVDKLIAATDAIRVDA